MTNRCFWCGEDPEYIAYHDTEWGIPVRDDRHLFELLCLEGQQAEQPGATDQGFVDFEIRVFRGGPDQGESAVLNPREERILLSTVEAMHFIDEQDGSQTMLLQAPFGGIHLLT